MRSVLSFIEPLSCGVMPAAVAIVAEARPKMRTRGRVI
jgi:hypothetical protein